MTERQIGEQFDEDEPLPGASLDERVEELEEQVEGLLSGGGLAIWLSVAALVLAVYAAFFK